MAGWIKLHRKMVKWEWYDDHNTCRLFLHLLLTVNYKPTRWKGIELLPGQRVFGLLKLSEECGLSVQTIRTCLTRLKSTREITIKSTNKFSILTIVKYDEYQIQEEEITIKSTNNQQTTNKQLTTSKEDISSNEDISKEGGEAHAREAAPIFDKSFYISLLKRKERGEPLTPQEKAYMQAYEKKLLGSSKAKQPTPEETQQALLEAAQWKQSKGIPLTASEEKLLKGEGK